MATAEFSKFTGILSDAQNFIIIPFLNTEIAKAMANRVHIFIIPQNKWFIILIQKNLKKKDLKTQCDNK